MRKFTHAIVIIMGCVAILSACGSGKKSDPFRKDSKGNTVPVENYVGVAIDETFRPVFDILMTDFRERFPDAFTDPIYVPEDSAIHMLLDDSIRSIVVTRTLSDKEKDYLMDKHRLMVKEKIVAFDAVALITNLSSPDTLISKDEIRGIVSGRIKDWSQLKHSNGQKGEIEVVFDNNGSSTLRYMKDSLCGGQLPKGKLRAAKTHEELISYISRTKNAIGVLGADYLRNPKDTTRLSLLSTVRVMSVGANDSQYEDDYYKPFQFYIASGSYPLTRSLFIITTDPRNKSMERNFYFYLIDAPTHNNMGQMIILKYSQLLPYVAVQSRSVVIKKY